MGINHIASDDSSGQGLLGSYSPLLSSMALHEPTSPGEREKGYDGDREKRGGVAENELSVAASDEADGGEDTGAGGGYRAWATVLGG